MTPPLTPPDCNLRDFGFMPWEVTRFRQSGLVANAEPEEILAAILLWGEAWHSVPAASLPDNDKDLARAAGYGRAVDAWLAVKEGALRGFVKCSDGRLYHHVVAEKARKSWEDKLKHRHRSYCATIRKHNERDRENGGNDQRTPPTFDQWEAQGRPEKVTRDIFPQPKQGDLALPEPRARAHGRVQEPCQEGENNRSGYVTEDDPQMSQPETPNVTRDTGSKGEGEGEGDSYTPPKPPAPKAPSEVVPPKSFDLEALSDDLARLGGVSNLQPSRIAANLDVTRKWVADGLDIEKLVKPTISKVLADSKVDRIASLAFFDSAIRKADALAKQRAVPYADRGQRSGGSKLKTSVDADDQRIPLLRTRLKDHLGHGLYADWLSPGKAALALNGRDDAPRLVVTAPSPFAADWIRKPDFAAKVATALETVTGSTEFVVNVEGDA